MFKKIVPLGFVLIIVSVIAGTTFELASLDQIISKAESIVYKKSQKSYDPRVSLGWTVSDLNWHRKSLGPSLDVKLEFVEENSTVIEFRNGNVLRLEHTAPTKFAPEPNSDTGIRRATLYCGSSDNDETTIAQIAFLIALTSNDANAFRELSDAFIGKTFDGFGSHRSIHKTWILKEGYGYQIRHRTATLDGPETTDQLVFQISPNPVSG